MKKAEVCRDGDIGQSAKAEKRACAKSKPRRHRRIAQAALREGIRSFASNAQQGDTITEIKCGERNICCCRKHQVNDKRHHGGRRYYDLSP
ncbi:hypothetical protein ER21_12900 [Cronobacter sakazakii]|nr:hypothetical protein ER21_12900 [Cronobacter sakazakii]